MVTSLPSTLSKFIWHFVKPYKVMIMIFVTLSFGAGAWGPINNLVMKYLVNLLSSPLVSPSLLILPATLLVLNFIIFDNITWRTIGYINYKFQPIIRNAIIKETFEYVLNSSHSYFSNNFSGRVANQIHMLADHIVYILYPILADFIRGSSLLILSFISTWYVNATFFWIMIIWFIIFSIFSIIMSHRLGQLSHIDAYAESYVSGQLVDSITNASTIRMFARKTYEVTHLTHALEKTTVTFRNKEFFVISLYFVQGMIIAGMLAGMNYFLIHLYSKNLITVGDFSLIIGLSMEVAYRTWHTMGQVNEFFQSVGKCKQSLDALIIPHEIKDVPNATNLRISEGTILFENVSFDYNDKKNFFNNLSISIPGGQKVGLVGYSGSGKSTFVNLILRLYDVQKGHIYIDNQDIKNVTQESLRKSIGMIPQDPLLFHRSILENIQYGCIDTTPDQVKEAAYKAHIHDVIMSMPEEYNTLTGERGVKISGGQRQRIAIARAFLKNAPILILDEATSQLDTITEQLIQHSLWNLMQNKTCLVIAHRLSTLLTMDRILVFDQGKIVEDGTHTELLAKNGLYKKLWETQVNGFVQH